MSFRRRASAAALLVALPAIGTVVAQDGAQVARGRQLLEAQCARCHAVGASDASPVKQAPALRQLRRRYPVDALAEALAEGIITGHPGMPEFAFQANDVAAIIAYLKSLPDPR
ncbi:MAG TPA: cytochrome c [Hyphomicrobiaceae bacterium]|nr:cytochrome c [Hyphomicrobiaceae bacterium]